jgi:hypothetical protein
MIQPAICRSSVRLLPRLCILPMLMLAGCAVAGFVAAKMPAPTVEAAYKGLSGQTVGVLVWADRAVRIDFENIQSDLAAGVQKRLQLADQKEKMSEVRNISWVDARRIHQWQLNHPELEGASAVELAKALRVTRLIYIEVNDFQTRSNVALELFRGSMNASVRVVEVEGGQARIAFSDDNISAVFPPSVPQDGTPNGSDAVMYAGTLQQMAIKIANRFIPHVEER